MAGSGCMDSSHARHAPAGSEASSPSNNERSSVGVMRRGRGVVLGIGVLLASLACAEADQFHPNKSTSFRNEEQLFKVSSNILSLADSVLCLPSIHPLSLRIRSGIFVTLCLRSGLGVAGMALMHESFCRFF